MMLYGKEYTHGGDIYTEPVLLDFSANTNPFGTAPAVMAQVRDALDEMHRYPDPYCRELVDAIADFEQVPRELILCGNGAAELIYAYCDALRPKYALELAPTFSEYSLGLKRVGCRVERYFLREETGFLPEEGILTRLEAQKPEALFLCNPNNPTGRTIPADLMEKILKLCHRENIALFVDECFCDLSDREESLKGMLFQYPNLFLLKAFTKSYGMAGIRLGYGLSANRELLGKMAQTTPPWNVSSLAQVAGVAALSDPSFLAKTRSHIFAQRQWLKVQLEDLGMCVCPSEANYLLFRGPEDLHEKLKARGILIRDCRNYPGLGSGWYRIGVRLREENELLTDAIRALR